MKYEEKNLPLILLTLLLIQPVNSEEKSIYYSDIEAPFKKDSVNEFLMEVVCYSGRFYRHIDLP